MTDVIRIKRRISGAAGAPATLATAEMAYNMADGFLYVGYGDNGSGVATSIKTFAKDNYVDPSGVYQPLDADLTTISGLTATTDNFIVSVSSAWASRTPAQVRTTLGLVIGTNAQAWDADLDAFAALTSGANLVPYYTGAGTMATTSLTASGRTVIGASGVTGTGSVVFSISPIFTGTPQFASIGASAASLTFYTNLGALVMTSSSTGLAMNSLPISGVSDPTNAQDAATKAYVDSVAQGLDVKPSVKVATTGNVTLSGEQTLDGVLTSASRILVKSQTAPAENGIYVTAAGAWARTTDMDAWTEVPGAFVFIEEGTTNADTGWVSTANSGGTLGTTAITWTQFSGAGSYIGGAGLTLTGTTFAVGASTGITVNADDVQLAGQALALHNVTTAADKLIYATGSATFSTTDFTSVARTLVNQTTQANMRTTGLGLGTMSTQAASAVAITGGTIDGVTFDCGTF